MSAVCREGRNAYCATRIIRIVGGILGPVLIRRTPGWTSSVRIGCDQPGGADTTNQHDITVTPVGAVGVEGGLGAALRRNFDRVVALTMATVVVVQIWRYAGVANVIVACAVRWTAESGAPPETIDGHQC